MQLEKNYLEQFIAPLIERGDVPTLCGIYIHKFKKKISQATIYKAMHGGNVRPEVVAVVLDYYSRKTRNAVH